MSNTDAAGSWRRRGGRPLVLGHRGAPHRAPENTLRAFELALEEGADGVELDVRLDADGNVVVAHDPTLERVSRGEDDRAVESLPWSELRRVDVGGGERIPRLEAVIDWARDRGTRLNIEVKQNVKRRAYLTWQVARMVREAPDAAGWLLLSSFHPAMLAMLARLSPETPAAWLVHDRQKVLKKTPGRRLVGAAAIHPQSTIATRRNLDTWKKAGLIVNVWTVNEPDEARRLSDLGVDGLISDRPGKIVAALENG